MNIEGTYTLQAAPEEVWNCLMDQQVLLHTIPGIESIEQVDKDTSTIAIHIKQAPLIGTYHGRVTVTEQHYPYHYRLLIEGEGRQSTINGTGSVHLNERAGSTIIAYQGSLTINRLGTLLPPSLVKGAAKLFIQQYFAALARQLHARRARRERAAGEEPDSAAVLTKDGGNIVIVPPPPLREPVGSRGSIFRTIVHLLGLGAGEAEEEARWESRLRRISILSVLLFLVWLGTRLPRRR